MKKILLLSACALTLLIGGCKKDTIDFTGYTRADGTTPDPGTGTGAGTVVTVNPAYNYQPVSKDSYWKRASSGVGQDPDTTTEVMLGTTLTDQGRLYYIASSKIASESETTTTNFYNSGDTYSAREVDADGDFTEIVYLKANLAVGQEWDAAEFKPSPDAQATGKIVEKGITRTVKGKIFKDVIHTKIIIKLSNGSGGFDTFADTDYYIAKGVGVIEGRAVVLGITVTTQLYEFSIK